MTAAATDTTCSTHTPAVRSLQREPSSITTGMAGSQHDMLQQLLCCMAQTAEAAEQLQRQRDAINQPQQQPQRQESSQGMPDSVMAAPQQQTRPAGTAAGLQGLLAQLLAQTQGTSTAPEAPGLMLPASLRPTCTQQQQQEAADEDDAGLAASNRSLQKMSSLADSSWQDTVAAADALLDLEFSARDAGSFTQKRPAILPAAPEGATPPPAAAATGGTRLAASLPAREPSQGQELAAVAAGVQRRSSTGTGVATGVAPAESASVAAASLSIGAGAGAGADVSAAGKRLSLQQQQLLALLSMQLSPPAPGGPTSQQQSWQDPAAAGSAALAAGGTPAATAVTVAAAAAAPPPAANAGRSFSSSGGTGTELFSTTGLRKLRQQLTLRQQQAAADRHSTAALQASMLPGIKPALSVPLSAAAAMAPASAGPGFTAGGWSAMTGGSSSVGAMFQVPSSGAQPSFSNLTSNTTLATPGGGSSSQVQAAAAAAATAAGGGGGGGFDGPKHDADLAKLCADYQTNRTQVIAIIGEALSQGILSGRAIRRLQLRNQQQQQAQRAPDSPSFTVATTSAGAAPTLLAGGGDVLQTAQHKRTRDQDNTEGAAAAEALDGDAPCSKVRRVEASADPKAAAAVQPDTTAITEQDVGREAPAAAAAADGASEQHRPPPSSAPAAADGGMRAAHRAVQHEAPPAAAPAAEVHAGPTSEQAAVDAAGTAAGEASQPPPLAAAGPAMPAVDATVDLLGRSVNVMVRTHGLSKRLLDKAASARKDAREAQSRAEHLTASNAHGQYQVQQLQLQNQLLQHHLRLAQLQLQVQQQQVQQAQVRVVHQTAAYPQLLGQVTQAVHRLVAVASHSSMPVTDRQELAAVAEELLSAAGRDA